MRPRIPIWLPLAATLALIAGLAAESYPELVDALNNSTIGRKAPDIALIKRAFTIKSPLEIEEPYIQRRVINDGIRGLHRQTYVRVGRRSGDRYDKITDNSVAIGSIVSPAAIAEAVRIVDVAQIYESEQGRQFDLGGTQYHVIATRFPLTQAELQGEEPYTGRIVLVTNLDRAAEKTRQILALLGAKIFVAIGISTTLSICAFAIPIVHIDRRIKRGLPADLPWWCPVQIADLAETIERDRTALTQAKASAEKFAKEVETVNHIAAHDIKADLTALNFGSELITETTDELTKYIGPDADPVLVEAIDTIKHFSGLNVKSAKNAFEVLDQRNKLYDLESKIEIANCSVTDLLDSLSAAFSPEPGEMRIHNECPETRQILADKSLLMTVLKNIVRNGFVHNESPLKRVEVKVSPIGHRTRIQIADNGVGMPPSYLENWGTILGKAAQLSNKRGGSGTGLYSIRAIVLAHKGASIDVTSAVGQGTTFTLEFEHVA